MPLFACSKCNAVENTALGAYWHCWEEPLCSECDTGTWHGRFEKTYADDGWEPEPSHPQFIQRKSVVPEKEQG